MIIFIVIQEMVVKMKITIEIDECADYGLLPYTVYSKLRKEYLDQMEKKHNKHFWSLGKFCDEATKQLYAQITGRSPNVKNLILTYRDAEKAFDLFKDFADVRGEKL